MALDNMGMAVPIILSSALEGCYIHVQETFHSMNDYTCDLFLYYIRQIVLQCMCTLLPFYLLINNVVLEGKHSHCF